MAASGLPVKQGDLVLAGGNIFDRPNELPIYLAVVLDRHDAGGNFTGTLLSHPPTDFYAGPSWNVDAVGDHTLYFTDNNHVVQRLDQGGTTRIGGEFEYVDALLATRRGDLLVAEGHSFGPGTLWQFNVAGQLVRTWDLRVWSSMDLAADGCTLVYPKLNTRALGPDWIDQWISVSRYDLCADEPLSDLVPRLPWLNLTRLRLLPDGGFLVASGYGLERRDAAGNLVWQRTVDQQRLWFLLALDPSGKTFWSGAYDKVWHFSVDSPEPLAGPFATGKDDWVFGGTVVGGWKAAAGIGGVIRYHRPLCDAFSPCDASSP